MTLRPEQAAIAVELLKKIPLFAGLSTAQCVTLAAGLELRSLATGKVVILEQEISKTLFILAKGSVSVSRRSQHEKKRIALLHAPNFFGEISMLSDSPASALVKTEEETQLFTLSRERFDALVSTDPLLGEVVRRNIETIKEQRPSLQKPSADPS